MVGAVVIGRNEGERLRRCLASLSTPAVARGVYVDSGSTDGSAALARSMGFEVVELDLSKPFTAARARNAGLDRLVAVEPGVAFVQFVDGDCEVDPNWIERGPAALLAAEKLAAVAGRVRERFPEATRYNRLCDLEWDHPAGPAKATGGNAMMRVEAVRKVGGFDGSLIAGEEPELCLRLRHAGHTVMRLTDQMVLHDAAMTRFGQWWTRSRRAGHAYAQGAAMHGATPERYNVKPARSAIVWGLLAPTALAGSAVAALRQPIFVVFAAAIAALYVLLWVKIYLGRRPRTQRGGDAALYATFTLLGKLPQAVGAVSFFLNRLLGKQTRIIEYRAGLAT